MKRFDAMKTFLIKRGFQSKNLKEFSVVSYELVFDSRMQFVLRLSKRGPKRFYEQSTFGISCGVRLNCVEEVLDGYDREVLKAPSYPEFLMITFCKQFVDTFDYKLIDERKVIDWIDDIIGPILENPNKMFDFYRDHLKTCDNPKDFGGFDGDYMIFRSLVVNLIDGDFQEDLPHKLLSKHGLEMYLEHQPFVQKLEWLKKKFKPTH